MIDPSTSIWQKKIDIAQLNQTEELVMPGYLGIKITEVGPNYLCGTMPVNERTKQPFGVLHGGASVVLAETLGSIGGYYCLKSLDEACFGLTINSNHIRSVASGLVTGKATPYHIGRTTQVWNIEIHNEDNKLVNVSRLTLAVVSKMRSSSK